MSDRKFEYDEELLSACARSKVAENLIQSEVEEEDPCSLLHQQHALHYNRPLSDRRMLSKDNNDEHHRRFERFVKTALLVHAHNSNSSSNNRYRLSLNQFADQDYQAFFDPADTETGVWDAWDVTDKEMVLSLSPLPYLLANSQDIIMDVAANLTVGHGGFGHLKSHSNRKKTQPTPPAVRDMTAEKIKFPNRGGDPHFAVPSIDDPSVEGELLKVKPRRKVEEELEDGGLDDNDEFANYLNWASPDNPDGVSIVRDAFDQGECGSCWAFAATGSLEASVSRTQAREAYEEYLERATLRKGGKSLVKIHEEALKFAQSVEEAAFQVANLSIQELLDCDSAADQGCIGGNPLLAFYFIHRYGLTTWSNYPYAGYEDKCHKKSVGSPIAKVKAWGIISPNHERHMELVLRYIGPIAVGVNAADRAFLSYQDGIFEKHNCKQGANHALLITGYGRETTEDGQVISYWIARNSWGKGWGENGYIRVKRGDGLKGTYGVCGIAASPSVALGGVLLTNRHRLAPYRTPESNEFSSDPLSTSVPTSLCARLGFESCRSMMDMVDNHRGLVLGLVGIVCATFLAVWPLSFQCRRRRQRRLKARYIQARGNVESTNPPPPPPTENDPLLTDRTSTNNYGAP